MFVRNPFFPTKPTECFVRIQASFGGETPLHVLAKSGSLDENISKSRRCEAIQMLLMHSADVHAVNPRGRGVLHLAVTEHDIPAIETLIEGMADVTLGEAVQSPSHASQ